MQEVAETTFNGKTREEIVDYCYYGHNLLTMVAEPRQVTEEEGEEVLTVKSLKKVLRCTICYDILNDPFTVKICLHRFCKKCIVNNVHTSGMCP